MVLAERPTRELSLSDIADILGDEAQDLLEHRCEGIPASSLHLPGPDFVTRVWAQSDRSPQVLRNLQAILDHGRLAGTVLRLFLTATVLWQAAEEATKLALRHRPDLRRERLRIYRQVLAWEARRWLGRASLENL